MLLHAIFCCSSGGCSYGGGKGRNGSNADATATALPSIPTTSKTPLVHALAASALQPQVAPFHFPGHRRGAAAPTSLSTLLGLAPFAHDLPELPELDNLFSPQDAIAKAQSQAAALFGADSTFFLVNGSTCGVHAAVMSICLPGQVLILSRNCHLSAFSAMVLSGVEPFYVMPSYDAEWDLAHGIEPSDVEQAFLQAKQQGWLGKVGAVLITSPTYHGICSNVKSIADICHTYNVPLIVDEAHGAHFLFHDELPETALQQGADIAVQSTHKVLSSLTQSAMLHVQGQLIDRSRVVKCLQTLQSSSPSYLLLASLDAATEQAHARGHVAFTTALRLAHEARRELEQIDGLTVLKMENMKDRHIKGAEAMDYLRVTVGLWQMGLSGFDVDDILRLEHHVIAELPLLRSITFAVSLGTMEEDISSLVTAFKSIAKSRSVPTVSTNERPPPSMVSIMDFSTTQSRSLLTPREAFFSATEKIGRGTACGRVCSELICPYPPGIPVLVPGERISQEAIDYLRAVLEQGGFVSGASDGSLDTFLVCREES